MWGPCCERTFPKETLEQIAVSYGVSVEQIAAENGIKDRDKIREGQELVIPVGRQDNTSRNHER